MYTDTAAGTVQVTFRNVGTGVATLVWLRALAGRFTIVGLVPDLNRLLLMPGEGFRLTGSAEAGSIPNPPPPGGGMAFVCDDALGNRIYFAHDGRRLVLRPPVTRLRRFWTFTIRRVPRDPPTRDDWAFSALYPRVDLQALTALPTTTEFLPKE